MNLHLVNDKLGLPQGIFIPISEWEEFRLKYKIEDIDFIKNKDFDISESLKTSLIEMSLIENGKLERKSAIELLEEL